MKIYRSSNMPVRDGATPDLRADGRRGKFTPLKTWKAIILSALIAMPALCIPGSSQLANQSAFISLAAGADEADELVYTSFQENATQISNPARGWYTDDVGDTVKINANNITLIMIQADLGAYKDRGLDETRLGEIPKLNEIREQFNMARAKKCSVIFRAAYTFDFITKPEPQNFDLILKHISQLKPVLEENADILYVVQAGFLGPWGEWHNSYYGDAEEGEPAATAQKLIFAALCDAVPSNAFIEIRRPKFVRTIMDGITIKENDAFSGSPISRIAIHNDALFNGEDDGGTYDEPGWNRAKELEWQNNHNKYAPFIAESNALKPQSNTVNAIPELNLLHASALNLDYYQGVISRWKSQSYAGMSTFQYIGANLGYRFVLRRAGIPADVGKGGALNVKLELENKGFGGLLQEKDFEIVIKNGSHTLRARVADDARKWYRENGLMQKNYYFGIPSDIDEGAWTVYASLSDRHASLKNEPAYSVQFSNTGIWESGMNRIGSFNVTNKTGGNHQVFGQISGDTPQSEGSQNAAEDTGTAVSPRPTTDKGNHKDYSKDSANQNSKNGIPVLKNPPSRQTPLDFSKLTVKALSISDKEWTGKRIKSRLNVTLLYYLNNKLVTKNLSAKTDYTLINPGKNKNIGKARVTVSAKPGGIFKGAKALNFNIIPRKPTSLKIKPHGKKSLKVTFKKVSKAQKVKKYKVTYRIKGAAKWKSKTINVRLTGKSARLKTAGVTLKNLKSGKIYQIKVYAVKGKYKGAPTGIKSQKAT